MRIFYTTKRIFWSNEGQDYLESTQFNEFFINQWIELPNVKSINWTSHYEASFYATDAFDATYFKIEKNNQTYYFFVQDIKNDSANGKFWYLTLDLYNTYGKDFIEQMKTLNPKVTFKRKHANRYFNSGVSEKRFAFDFDRQRYLLTPPPHLVNMVDGNNNYPTKKQVIYFNNLGQAESLEPAYNALIPPPKYKASYYNRVPSQIQWTYLVLKRPGTMPDALGNSNEGFNFFFLPVGNWVTTSISVYIHPNYSTEVEWFNEEVYLSKIPGDLIVGRIRTGIPPCAFRSCDFYAYIYGKNPPEAKSVLCLSNPYFPEFTTNELYDFTSFPDTGDYTNYSHEPLLSLPPFRRLMLNENTEISPLSFFKTSQNNKMINDNHVPWVGMASTTMFLRPPLGALDRDNHLKYFVDVGHKLPTYGDVLNSYLLNNINAINTGIQAKIGTTALGFVGSATNIVGSLATGNVAGAIQGSVGIGQSIWGLAQSFRQVEATKADLGNRVDELKDSYGKGVVVEFNEALTVTTYSIPQHLKELVFKDIYFSGYLFNGVDNFNTYRNRTKFNYFEITDANQFLNLYTTYPKQIISDLSEKFLNGIRLWRTTAVNFDMTLDNREISFD